MIPKNRFPGRVPPPPSAESENIDGVAGPPVYHQPMPVNVTRVVPIAADEWIIGVAGPPMNPEQAAAWRESRRKKAGLNPDRPPVTAAEQLLKLRRRVRRLERLVQKLIAGGTNPEPRSTRDEF